tara:strand:+ start:171 stop:557 length:387 start_codon:yes stop_codon:yes gene_type:complete
MRQIPQDVYKQNNEEIKRLFFSKPNFWYGNSKLQTEVELLQELIPFMGPVEKPRSENKKLEKFRVASRKFYRFYNDGDTDGLYSVFGILISFFRAYPGTSHFTYRLYEELEKKMEIIVQEAWQEQYNK